MDSLSKMTSLWFRLAHVASMRIANIGQQRKAPTGAPQAPSALPFQPPCSPKRYKGWPKLPSWGS